MGEDLNKGKSVVIVELINSQKFLYTQKGTYNPVYKQPCIIHVSNIKPLVLIKQSYNSKERECSWSSVYTV